MRIIVLKLSCRRPILLSSSVSVIASAAKKNRAEMAEHVALGFGECGWDSLRVILGRKLLYLLLEPRPPSRLQGRPVVVNSGVERLQKLLFLFFSNALDFRPILPNLWGKSLLGEIIVVAYIEWSAVDMNWRQLATDNKKG